MKLARGNVAGHRKAMLDFAQELADFLVAVELLDLLFQDQVRAHAAAGKVPHAFGIFGAVRVRVEVAAKNETSKPDRGVVEFRRHVINQRGEVVVEGTWKLLVRRRPA